jgi:D-hydroxyproline dehydrogenase subunit beta
MGNSTDVLVAGGGIVGAACAYALAREKASVRIIDAQGGDSATAACMGHIVVMDDSEAQLALTHFSQILWDALAEEVPDAFAYERVGTIWVAADDEEMVEARRKHAFYLDHGIKAEILGPHELREAEPNLRGGLAGGLLVPNDSVVYPPAAATFLIRKACELGAIGHLGKSISSIGQGTARLSDGTVFNAGMLVNAVGQHAAELTPGITLMPRKGHLVITDRYPGAVRHQLVELGYLKSAHALISESVAFNVQPRETGQVLIGSSRQLNLNDHQVDTEILSRMLNRAFRYMPKLAQLSAIRVWTGIRSATPDNLPLIGPWEGDETVFLATGHEGLGITSSLATARLAADHLLRRKPSIPIEPYLPSRQFKEGVLV